MFAKINWIHYSGHGDKSFRDTIESLPSGYRMCAYAGLTLVNSTSSTSGPFLLF